MIIAARVPSRDNANSVIGPLYFSATADGSTGNTATMDVVASWIIRTTRPPSITVHTASSSAQLGRVSVLPPTASLPFAPLAPTQSDICGSSPACTRTTDATCRPLRESAAETWLPTWPKDPRTGTAASRSTVTMDPFNNP
ncbi:Uncharacterised protein [Mycobacteroides abscessus subsp. abscessus]|nr:Uncharacterised protein [Mycobacteroides abscessus subsp. abscessus]